MGLKSFSELVLTKVQLNLKSEARKNYLSYLWWLLEPALFVGVFYIVFGLFLARGTSEFLVFLLCGQVPFLWFARSLTNGASSIEQGRGLMQQIKIPKVFFVVVTILQDFFKALCVFALLMIFLLSYGYTPDWSWLALVLVIGAQLILVSGITIFIAMLVPFVPDFKFLVSTGIQLVMFASGIFYDYKAVILDKHHDIFLLNPMANLLEQYRRILMHNQWPQFDSLMLISLGGLVLIAACLFTLNKLDSQYPRLLAQ